MVEKIEYPEVDKAVDDIVAFTMPRDSDPAIQSGIEREVRLEIQQTEILLDEFNLSAGLRASVLDPVMARLADFNRLRHAFNASIAQYKDRLDSERNAKSALERIEAECDARLKAIRDKFESDEKNKSTTRTYQETKHKYEDFKSKRSGGGEPRIVLNWIYIPILLLIGGAELYINYRSLIETLRDPGLAFGFAAIVGGIVAMASHIHGTRLVAWVHYFGPDKHNETKIKEFILVGMGLFIVLLAFAMISYTRYEFAMEIISKNAAKAAQLKSSTAAVQESPLSWVIPALIANVFVWLAGVAFAYLAHDKDPDYAEAKILHLRAAKNFEKATAAKNKEEQVALAAIEKMRLGEQNKHNNISIQVQPIINKSEIVATRARDIEKSALDLATILAGRYQRTFVALVTASSLNPALVLSEPGRLGQKVDGSKYSDLKISLNSNWAQVEG